MYDYPANTAISSPGEVRGYKALLIEISGVFSIVRQNGNQLFNISYWQDTEVNHWKGTRQSSSKY